MSRQKFTFQLTLEADTDALVREWRIAPTDAHVELAEWLGELVEISRGANEAGIQLIAMTTMSGFKR